MHQLALWFISYNCAVLLSSYRWQYGAAVLTPVCEHCTPVLNIGKHISSYTVNNSQTRRHIYKFVTTSGTAILKTAIRTETRKCSCRSLPVQFFVYFLFFYLKQFSYLRQNLKEKIKIFTEVKPCWLLIVNQDGNNFNTNFSCHIRITDCLKKNYRDSTQCRKQKPE